ncbi:MAG TPA: metalloregulator ArsR/SmtB family transcription factor [Candidatus Dormibacteraeota bacterium]|jgi:DNA-binding transcriptional ArsR family regulator|nr:metalloregulator ArsR/SmtB family transcription factor [Candidatus Dormibacteraeota bacterium]
MTTRRRRPGAEPDTCQVRCVNEADVARMRGRLLPSSLYAELAALFDALADPTRARIVHVLLSQEMCTCDLAAVVGVSEPSVSQHLRLLRTLRLVRFRRAGKVVYYSLDDGHVADLVRIGLSHLGHSGEVIPLAPLPALGDRSA